MIKSIFISIFLLLNIFIVKAQDINHLNKRKLRLEVVKMNSIIDSLNNLIKNKDTIITKTKLSNYYLWDTIQQLKVNVKYTQVKLEDVSTKLNQLIVHHDSVDYNYQSKIDSLLDYINILKKRVAALNKQCLSNNSILEENVNQQKINKKVYKTYSGTFEQNCRSCLYSTGIAKYQYYEGSNGERIFEGPFSFHVKYDLITTGQYINNRKTGIWTVKNSFTAPSESYTELYTGFYSDGNLNGICTYTKTENTTKKIIRKITCNFINNKVVGKYEEYAIEGNIKYYLNSKSLVEGDYTEEYISEKGIAFEISRKYNSGKLYFSKKKNLATGDIEIERDSNEEIIYDTTLHTCLKNSCFWNSKNSNDTYQGEDIQSNCCYYINDANPFFYVTMGANPVSFRPVIVEKYKYNKR